MLVLLILLLKASASLVTTAFIERFVSLRWGSRQTKIRDDCKLILLNIHKCFIGHGQHCRNVADDIYKWFLRLAIFFIRGPIGNKSSLTWYRIIDASELTNGPFYWRIYMYASKGLTWLNSKWNCSWSKTFPSWYLCVLQNHSKHISLIRYFSNFVAIMDKLLLCCVLIFNNKWMSWQLNNKRKLQQ